MEKPTIDEAIKLWKELKINELTFNFYCGGDEMGDTTITMLNDKGKEIENEVISKYIDDEIYNKVEFYVNSDGHYMGESGNVIVTLNDDEESFDYSKSAESEWNENITSIGELKLTKIEEKFIRDRVLNINGGEGDFININFSGEFILTDKEEKVLEKLEKKIDEFVSEFVPNDVSGELQEWYTFTTNNEITIIAGKLQIEITNSETIYRDSE